MNNDIFEDSKPTKIMADARAREVLEQSSNLKDYLNQPMLVYGVKRDPKEKFNAVKLDVRLLNTGDELELWTSAMTPVAYFWQHADNPALNIYVVFIVSPDNNSIIYRNPTDDELANAQ